MTWRELARKIVKGDPKFLDSTVRLYLPDTVERLKGFYRAGFDIVDPAMEKEFPEVQRGEPIIHLQ